MRAAQYCGCAIWVAIVSLWLAPGSAQAQTCWEYTDDEDAKVPIDCVDPPGESPTCTSGSSDCCWPADCATAVSATPQKVRVMHDVWHDCFGKTGGASPPVGRGQRWYAFHRQFELDFNQWRSGEGYANIESLHWCPDMEMPWGHYGGFSSPCGAAPNRPNSTSGAPITCDLCGSFPSCLFLTGAGPQGCSAGDYHPDLAAGAPDCGSITSLEDFPNIDEIAEVLDEYYHGVMHLAVGVADRYGATCDPADLLAPGGAPGATSGCYILDSLRSECSPRDPMFWRLHKALDDVVRAWQNYRAVDVMVIIDQSGSMSALDAGGAQSRLEAAKEAAGYFASFLDGNRPAGMPGTHRLGLVSYGSTGTVQMGLTAADASSPFTTDDGLVNTAFEIALDSVNLSGCTSIGDALEQAVGELCGGDCSSVGGSLAAGENERKAILLLTDGVENIGPCLNDTTAAPCGSSCGGSQFDLDTLGFAELVAIGFGDESSINGEQLTLLAESQGGVYLHNPASTPEADLKNFFIKAFGQLTDEFTFLDPQGFLPASELAGEPVEYTSCGDTQLSFASGWKTDLADSGDLQMLVSGPSGDLVRDGKEGAQVEHRRLWSFDRIRMPQSGESDGAWRGQLVRPHQSYVNGFLPDTFANPEEGLALVRRQIQRLCPSGCDRVLYFEQGQLGPESAYAQALIRELGSGLIGTLVQAVQPVEFEAALALPFDLIVYSNAQDSGFEPYDSLLGSLVCGGQKSILSDVRSDEASNMLGCLGAQHDGIDNWSAMDGDDRLFEGSIAFVNPGHPKATYGLRALAGTDVQATASLATASADAIVAQGTGTAALDQYWFVNVLGRGLSKLDMHMIHDAATTAPDRKIMASVRMLPSYIPAAGFDNVAARVEVEHPLIARGNYLIEYDRSMTLQAGDEVLTGAAAGLTGAQIPTAKTTFELFDDGTHGDVNAGNHTWTSDLAGIGYIDGMYTLRYVFDLTLDGCTTHREFVQTLFVEIGVDGSSSPTTVLQGIPVGELTYTPIVIRPTDIRGNLYGPGRFPALTCGPPQECSVVDVADNSDGSYTTTVATGFGVAGAHLTGFGTVLDVGIPCSVCPLIESIEIEPSEIPQDGRATAVITLSDVAPEAAVGGALVQLSSSSTPLAEVPENVIVPAGSRTVNVEVQAHHSHEVGGETVQISAIYGGQSVSGTLRVLNSPGPPAAPVLNTVGALMVALLLLVGGATLVRRRRPYR